MSVIARLEFEPLNPAAELEQLLGAAQSDGAVVSFVGVARPHTSAGEIVKRIVLEHHPRLTLKSLQDIADEGAGRFGTTHIRVVHRCGELAPGEPIVFAGAAAVHRRAAFQAADYLMDRLKTEAVFWKREDGPADSKWIEPTEDDYADRGRWE